MLDDSRLRTAVADGDARPLFRLSVNRPDPRGYMVREILWSVREFEIYRTDNGIFPLFSGDVDLCEKQKLRYLALGDKIADYNHLLDSIPAPRRKSAVTEEYAAETRTRDTMLRQHYEREFARCIAQALMGQPEDARKSLEVAGKRLCTRIANRARIEHLIVNIILAAAVVGLGLASTHLGYTSVFFFDEEDFALAVIMGSVGALFSTIVGLKSLDIDPTIARRMHWIYGAQRVMVGALGALILYFGLRSGLLTGLFEPPLAGGASNTLTSAAENTGSTYVPLEISFENYWLSFVCLLAGFSERLVPNLLDAQADAATT